MNKNQTYWAIWGILIVLYLIFPLRHLDGPAWNYDEGPQLQAAALANQGYKLYADVVLNKPPLLTWWLQLAFKVGGTNVVTGRTAVLLLTLIGFLALGALAVQWWGPWAGTLTMAAFLALPSVPFRAAAVMNDLPVMTMALLSFNSATRFRRTQHTPWLVLSALTYAAVLMLHPMLLFLIVPIGLILIMPKQGPLRLFPVPWRTILPFALCTLAIVLPWLATTHRAGMLKWVVHYNSTPVDPALIPYYDQSWQRIWAYLSPNYAFLLLAITSFLLIFQNKAHRFWLSILLIWFSLTFLILLTRRPMWNHYPLLLMYSIVLAVGGGLQAIGKTIAQWIQAVPMSLWRRGLVVLNLVGVALLINNRFKQTMAWPTYSKPQQTALARLRQNINPGDFIISDGQFQAFNNGILVPPPLADTSLKRIATGYLRAGDVMNAILTYEVQTVVFARGRFRKVPHLTSWLETTMDGPSACFDSLCLYPLAKVQPRNDILDEKIRLRGYRLISSPPLHAGEALTLTLYWESLAPTTEDLSAFVHLIDTNGTLWAQHDGPPFMGQHPTYTWHPGDVVPDPRPLRLPADLSSGQYHLYVGMYEWPSLERLPAVNAEGTRWRNDSIHITSLTVKAP